MVRHACMAVLLSVLLTGCGGGGDSDDDISEPPPPADIQTSVPAPLYPADSSELKVFNFVDSLRQQLGLGLLAQNAQLDQAVANHARYLDFSGSREEIESGLEDPLKTHFTGVTTQDRCNHVGYPGGCPQGDAWSEVRFRGRPSPYMGLLMLAQGPREIGLAGHSTVLFGAESNGPEIQLALPSGATPQRQAQGFLLVTELWGAFHVQINAGERLTVDGFRVRDALGQELAGDVLVEATDPVRRVPAHAAMFVPTSDRVVCDGRAYTVQFAGKRDGVPFTLTRNLAIAPYLYCG